MIAFVFLILIGGHMKTSPFQKVVFAVAAVALIAAASPYLAGQAQPTPAAQAPGAPGGPGAAGPGRAGGGGPQWGRGPIRVMVVTKGHPFGPREDFFSMFDSMGADISWSSVEHPAAEYLLSPKYSSAFDVYVFYDRAGEGFSTQAPRGGGPAPTIPPNAKLVSNDRYYPQPPPELKEEFPKLLRAGDKGFVFLHHSNASWVQVWPEYSEVVGSACDWDSPVTVRGIEHPPMGFFGNTPQKITIVDKTHPIMQGISDFEITDESYNCVFFEDSVHPLARTDFNPMNAPPGRNGAPPRMLNPKVAPSNLSAYVKVAENSPVAYIQFGHGASGWSNPIYRHMVLNAIKWAASPESKAWAKANPKKIFK
jgi:uncharacterized protein